MHDRKLERNTQKREKKVYHSIYPMQSLPVGLHAFAIASTFIRQFFNKREPHLEYSLL